MDIIYDHVRPAQVATSAEADQSVLGIPDLVGRGQDTRLAWMASRPSECWFSISSLKAQGRLIHVVADGRGREPDKEVPIRRSAPGSRGSAGPGQ